MMFCRQTSDEIPGSTVTVRLLNDMMTQSFYTFKSKITHLNCPLAGTYREHRCGDIASGSHGPQYCVEDIARSVSECTNHLPIFHFCCLTSQVFANILTYSIKSCQVSGGYHCLEKLERQTSETAYEKSHGACRPKSETCHKFCDDLSTLLEPLKLRILT